MSRHPTKASPIGRTWTRVLRFVHEVGEATLEQVVAALRPAGADAAVREVRLILGAMRARDYLRAELGSTWSVGDAGQVVIDEIARPIRRQYRTPFQRRKYASARRAALKAAGVCISNAAHGPATRGVRCEGCHEAHRKSA